MTGTTHSCGIGGWGGPLPGDPDNNASLNARDAFGGVDVYWSLPATNPYAVAYTKVWRSEVMDFNTAIVIASVGGDFFYDKNISTVDTVYYYWIQFVSVNGTVGAPIGPDQALSRPPIKNVISMLSADIEESMLSNALRAQLGQIALNYGELQNEVEIRSSAVANITDALAQVQTNLNDAIAVISQEITSRQDGDSALVQSVNSVAVANSNAVALIATESEARVSGDSALALQITTAETTFGDNLAAVETGLQTSITTINGELDSIGALYTAKVNVNGLIGGFGIYNDGSTVDAGFDVDTFWVGKTSANQVKPFIITGGEVFLDKAVIADASINSARIENGAIINAKIENAAITTLKIGDQAVSITKYNVFTYSPPQQPSVLTPMSTYTVNIPESSNYIIFLSVGRAWYISGFVPGQSTLIQEMDLLIDGQSLFFSNFAYSDMAVGQSLGTRVFYFTAGTHEISFRYRMALTGPGSIAGSGLTESRIYLFGAYR